LPFPLLAVKDRANYKFILIGVCCMAGIFEIDDIKRISVPIAKKYGVKKLALFGSYTRGRQTSTSDIDFLIEKGAIQGWEFFGFINNLEDDLGVHVDVFTYDSLKDSLIADALQDEVVLYEG
jgi:predicted nucleotidyltransferase